MSTDPYRTPGVLGRVFVKINEMHTEKLAVVIGLPSLFAVVIAFVSWGMIPDVIESIKADPSKSQENIPRLCADSVIRFNASGGAHCSPGSHVVKIMKNDNSKIGWAVCSCGDKGNTIPKVKATPKVEELDLEASPTVNHDGESVWKDVGRSPLMAPFNKPEMIK